MLIQLQGYNFRLTYNKGSDNILADGLSRLPSPGNSDPIELDVRVDTVRFSSDRIEQLRNCTTADPLLNQLRETIITGWPETIKQLPTDIRVFWGLRDQLSIDDGLILKGQQIVIPQTLQEDILKQLHTAHLGQEKTKLLAKDTVYWKNNLLPNNFGKPSTLYETSSPDWAPTLRLGHDKDKNSSRKVRRKRKVLADSTDSIPPLSACNPDLQLCTPFLNIPLEPYNRGVYKPLESKEAMDLLWLPDEIFLNKPPCQPANGEIYLLKIGPLQESGEWKKDGYEWLKRGSSVLTINRNPALRKFTFCLSVKNRQDGLSQKHVYRLFSNNRKFVIHYLGGDERQTSYQQSADINDVPASQSISGRPQYYCQLGNDTQQTDSSIYWDLASGTNDKQLQTHVIPETMSSEEGNELVSIELNNHDQQRINHSFTLNKVRGHKRSASETNHQQPRRMFPEVIPLQLPVEEMTSNSVASEGVDIHSQRISRELQEQRRGKTNISAGNNDSIIIDEHDSMPSLAKMPRIEASIISHVPMNEVRFQSQPFIAASEKEKRTLVVPNHQVSVMSNMFSLWKTGRLCDTYISNGTTNILIHKMVLGAVCPKVLSVLYSTPSNVFSKVTFPSSISKEALLAFAEYMYSGVLNLDEDILSQLKIIAQRLDMKDFEQLCSNELQKVRITSLLSTIMEPILLEPASLSGLLSNNKQKAAPTNEIQPADLSPLLKLLENSHYSARSQLPGSKPTPATTVATSCSSTLVSRDTQRSMIPTTGDSEVNIKSEDDDNGCKFTAINSSQESSPPSNYCEEDSPPDNPHVLFHRLPWNNIQLRTEWVKLAGYNPYDADDVKHITKDHRICSLHFAYRKRGINRQMLPVPTLNLPQVVNEKRIKSISDGHQANNMSRQRSQQTNTGNISASLRKPVNRRPYTSQQESSCYEDDIGQSVKKAKKEFNSNSDVLEEDSSIAQSQLLNSAKPTECPLKPASAQTPFATFSYNTPVSHAVPNKQRCILIVSNHQQSVMTSLSSLWKAGKLCDAIISNGTENVKIHKMVLSAVCPKMLNIFDSVPQNNLPKYRDSRLKYLRNSLSARPLFNYM
ncbi:unnamed protein product [Acanthosepion pharaonis]|uniref:BTB domain-containing protein n=1 Tax=Acanthosepion pharaonis TaxID=158019 RepID=A0A812AX34_ACAPH|nr:unnamed protein product [Sepia pharaonis]